MDKLNKAQIARIYADIMSETTGHDYAQLFDHHLRFADAMINKNAKALAFIANGLNESAKKAFTKITGIQLPKQQGRTWAIICEWAKYGPEEQEKDNAQAELDHAKKTLSKKFSPSITQQRLEELTELYLRGYTEISFIPSGTTKKAMVIRCQHDGSFINLSAKGLSSLQPLAKALLNALKVEAIKTDDILAETARERAA